MYETLLTDITDKFILLSTNVDGNTIYCLGYRTEFGLFKLDFHAGSRREAIKYVKAQGEQEIARYKLDIRCFGLIKTFLDESESITFGLDRLAEFAHRHDHELYADQLIFEYAAHPGHAVLFKPHETAPSFVLNENGEYYEFVFSYIGEFDETRIHKDMKPHISEFCTIGLSKIYEADKSRYHLQKYRDARFAVDLGL